MRTNIIITLIVVIFQSSCSKYLEERPSSVLYLPETIEDLQALLDNNILINFQAASSLIESIADDYFVLDQRYESMSPNLQSAYIWEDSKVQVQEGWVLPYRIIYICNIVLENVNKVESKIAQRNNVEGSALFYRALSYYYLLQLYCKPYSSSADIDPGIIIRTSSSITQYEKRSSVKACYDHILSDLELCLTLLPVKADNLMRPGTSAVKALMARIYLSMSDFENAEFYASQVISENPYILNYNELLILPTPGMPDFLQNREILYFSALQSNSLVSATAAIIDTSLILEYDENDLRKSLYFVQSPFGGGPGRYRFIGSYYNQSNSSIFFGFSTDEMRYILAESLARRGDIENALNVLNSLLRNRYKTNTYIDFESTDQAEVIKFILKERRKGLVFRGLRWTDIRRLNLLGEGIGIKRRIKGIHYELAPNDLRAVLFIPDIEVTRSGIPQNPR